MATGTRIYRKHGPNDISRAVAARLLEARLESGMTLREVESRIGFKYTNAAISWCERGLCGISVEFLAVIAPIYGRPLSWFLQDIKDI